jgi:hypothetical protein
MMQRPMRGKSGGQGCTDAVPPDTERSVLYRGDAGGTNTKPNLPAGDDVGRTGWMGWFYVPYERFVMILVVLAQILLCSDRLFRVETAGRVGRSALLTCPYGSFVWSLRWRCLNGAVRINALKFGSSNASAKAATRG